MTNGKTAIAKTNTRRAESPKRASVSKVREDLKNVIETMGPHTPNNDDNDTTCSVCISTDFSSVSRHKDNCDASAEEKVLSYFLEDSNASESTVQEMERNDVSVQATHPPCYLPYQQYKTNHKDLGWDKVPRRPSRLSRFFNYLDHTFNQPNYSSNKDAKDLYKIDIQQDNARNDGSPPRRLIFDLVDGVAKANTKTVATCTSKPVTAFPLHVSDARRVQQLQRDEFPPPTDPKKPPREDNRNLRREYEERPEARRDEIYFFDHGNAEYLQTTDTPAVRRVENTIEQTEKYTTSFWGECFGLLHIGVAFVMAFFMQLLRFVLHAILRPALVGTVQMLSDYLFKPLLTTAFNGLLQPVLIFLFNTATSVRDLFKPLADCCGYFVREVAVLCKAMRLVQVENAPKP